MERMEIFTGFKNELLALLKGEKVNEIKGGYMLLKDDKVTLFRDQKDSITMDIKELEEVKKILESKGLRMEDSITWNNKTINISYFQSIELN